MDTVEMVFWTNVFTGAAMEASEELQGSPKIDAYNEMIKAWYASWELRLKIQSGLL